MDRPISKQRDHRLAWRYLRSIIPAAALSGFIPGAAFAQATSANAKVESDQLQEVVVTVQRRTENLQKVPITVSALSAETLSQSGIVNARDLGTVVPGLVFSSVVGYANPYLRGIGSTATGPGKENPIAIYVDGVYVAAQSAGLMGLSNIAGVEVAKGPQGTLFGRNATGGAIQISTLDPLAMPSLTASIGYGNYNTAQAQLYATTGIVDGVAADIAVAYSNQAEGYATNLANGADLDRTRDLVVRSKVVLEPSDLTKITLIADYGRTTGIPTLVPAPGTVPQFDPPVSSTPRDAYGRPQPYLINSQWGVSATVSQDFSFATLTSITAYRDTDYDSLFDSTLTAEPGTTFFVQGKEPHKQFTQELQLASNSAGPLNWVVGAYYFEEHSGDLQPTTIGGESFALFGLPSGLLQSPDRDTYSGAAFGQGTYAITDTTKFTLGLRYTNERRTNHFVETLPDFGIDDIDFRGTIDFHNISWRLALSQDFSDDVMGYVSYNRGYKSGVWNTDTSVLPEKLDAAEIGLKSVLFESRLRLNASIFYYKYENIQTTSYPDGNLVITNGAEASLSGLDLDAELIVTPEIKLTAGLEALHSRYDSFPDAPISVPVAGGGTEYVPGSATGNPLARAPELTFNVAGNYAKVFNFGKVAANLTYSYNDGWFGEADNRLTQGAYSLVNTSIAIGTEDDSFIVKFWGNNLLDEDYAVALAAQTNGDFIEYAPPLTYGVTVTKKF